MSLWVIIAAAVAAAVLIGWVSLERRIRIDLKVADQRVVARGGELPRWRQPIMTSEESILWARLGQSCLSAIGLGFLPTILFVLTYQNAPVRPVEKIFVAAAVLGLATLAATLFRVFRPLPRPSPFPWRNILIFSMAGLTFVLQDDLFIKVRPTVTSVVGALLAAGALIGVGWGSGSWMENQARSLPDAVGRKARIGIVLSGIVYAALNLYVWQATSEAFWVYFQLWGPMLFFMTFTALGSVLWRDELDALRSNKGGGTPSIAEHDDR